MKTRAITGFFFVLAMLGSVLLGVEVFSVFYWLLATACLYEFYSMFEQQANSETASSARPDKRWGLLLGFLALGLLVGVDLGFLPVAVRASLIVLLPLLMVLRLYNPAEKPFESIATTVLGLLYVLIPFYCFYRLAFIGGEYNALLPLGFLLLLWTNDTGAYLIGRAFGRHKLFLRISPGKTWQGFVGGLISSILVGFILHRYTGGVLPAWQWISLGVIVSIGGTYGDLVESMLKRSLQVKDSGNLLPGHGGLLDRFDGLLIAAPTALLFFTILQAFS